MRTRAKPVTKPTWELNLPENVQITNLNVQLKHWGWNEKENPKDRYIEVDSLILNGIKYDTEQIYHWDDTDFPSGYPEEIVRATEAARKDGYEGSDAWVDYLDSSVSMFTFTVESFIIHGNDVEANPNCGLGRIPVDEIYNDKTERQAY